MGTLYLWANTDVRLSSISLDLIETGGGIKFTGAEWLNPNNRWVINQTPVVTNDKVRCEYDADQHRYQDHFTSRESKRARM
jgi:hypothetical protein